MAEQGEIHTVVLEPKSGGAQSDADAKFACERQAFWAMHAQLLSIYEGKYVAVLNGQVVENDVDEGALMQRVYQKFGYQPVYVQWVTSGSLPIYRLMIYIFPHAKVSSNAFASSRLAVSKPSVNQL